MINLFVLRRTVFWDDEGDEPFDESCPDWMKEKYAERLQQLQVAWDNLPNVTNADAQTIFVARNKWESEAVKLLKDATREYRERTPLS